MERDDLIVNDQYPLDAHHSEEEGVKKRKHIWKITFWLSAITTIEVLLGVYWLNLGLPWQLVKWTFLILTVYKAFLIVFEFMHLGDERSNFKWVLLGPYIFFILYIAFIVLTEAYYVHDVFQALSWWN